jgi:hypothetical protein
MALYELLRLCSFQWDIVDECTNDDLERMWEKVDIVYFMVLSWHFPRETEDDHEKPSHDSQFSFRIQTMYIPNLS